MRAWNGPRSSSRPGGQRAASLPARAALRLIAGLAALIAIGTLLLALPISGSARPLRLDEALFMAVSGLATTGLAVITPGEDLSIFGQLVLLVMMQVGGIGFMVGAVIVFRLLGRRVTLEERTMLRNALGDVSSNAVVRLTGRVVTGVLLIEAAGALALWLNWQRLFGPGRAAYYAVFHAVSAFSNASFDLFSGTPDAPAAFPTDAASLLTLSTLVLVGGIGMPVLADLVQRPRTGRLSLHTRLTLATAGALLAAGTLVLFVGESQPGSLFAEHPWPRRLLLSYFHSASSRTSGFVLVPLDDMAPPNVLVLLGLMFVGASPASTGGGITTSTFVVLLLAMWRYIQGHDRVMVGGRTIPTETVLKAVAIVVVSLLVIIFVTWALLLTQRVALAEALFEAVSAFSTTGYTLGLTPRLNLAGRLLIAATMFWGRLGALTVVVALARPGHSAAVKYPEEQVLIG